MSSCSHTVGNFARLCRNVVEIICTNGETEAQTKYHPERGRARGEPRFPDSCLGCFLLGAGVLFANSLPGTSAADLCHSAKRVGAILSNRRQAAPLGLNAGDGWGGWRVESPGARTGGATAGVPVVRAQTHPALAVLCPPALCGLPAQGTAPDPGRLDPPSV